jgi:predicted RNA polymerase sigma factor
MVQGPAAGLAVLDPPSTHDRIAAPHHLPAVRAHLLDTAGDHDAARAGYRMVSRSSVK